jgi:hypothetical protein
MISDKRLQLSTDQAVTASAISSVIDLAAGATTVSNTLVDIANGEPMVALVTVKEAATAAGAATVAFSLESDSTADLATSATVHAATAAIGKATLVLGYQFAIALPAAKTYERYLGARFTVATGPLTAGKFDVQLMRAADLQNAPTYKGAPL